jgi:hypothetical protein
MIIDPISAGMSGVVVNTTSNRGFTPEEVADRCVDRIISVGNQAHPAIRDQAQAFKEQIRDVVTFYIKDAIKNDRHTIATRLRGAGYPGLLTILEN